MVCVFLSVFVQNIRGGGRELASHFLCKKYPHRSQCGKASVMFYPKSPIAHVFALSAMIGLFFSSCDKKTESGINPMPEFTATISSNETRTALDVKSVVWSEGDKVAIFAGNDLSAEYKVKEGGAGARTTTLVPVKSVVETGRNLNSNVAFYPYDNVNACSNHNGGFLIQVQIPSVQNYVANSFGLNSLPMTAVSKTKEDTQLAFKNVYGVMNLKVKMEDVVVKQIVVRGNSGEMIAGLGNVFCSYGGVPSIEFSTTSDDTITLDCGSGVDVSPSRNAEFYIPMPPVTFSSGITVRFITNGEEIVRKTTDAVTIKRSAVLNMPEVSSSKEWTGNSTEDLDQYDYPDSWTE